MVGGVVVGGGVVGGVVVGGGVVGGVVVGAAVVVGGGGGTETGGKPSSLACDVRIASSFAENSAGSK